MVRVPEYTPDVLSRPILQTQMTVRASPDAFGAAAGRGLAAAGQGMMNLADSMRQVQALEDAARAKDADNQYAAWAREAMYGEGGFMTLQGRAAVDAREAFERQAADQRRQIGSGLTGGAAASFSQASSARLNNILQQSVVHTANERKTWVNDASAARIDSFANDALVNYQNPEMIQRNIALGQAELRQQAELNGWSGEVLADRERTYISTVHKNVALRMAEADPVAARQYMRDNSEQISGADQAALERVFTPLMVDEEAKRHASEFLDGQANGLAGGAVRGDATTFAAPDLPQVAYSFLGAISGPESGHRYNVRFDGSATGARFDDFSDHPRIAAPIPQGFAAAGQRSSAAGRYQFVQGTWDRAAAAVGAMDFSPANQDRAAWWLAKDDYRRNTGRDLQLDLVSGNYGAVRRGLSGTWEALSRMSDAQFAQLVNGSGQGGGTVAFLDGISNPAVRAATASRISTMLTLQEKQEAARINAIKTTAFGMIDQGMSPDSIPADIRAQLGRTEMDGLWSYHNSRIERGQPVTDEKVLYDLQTLYATNPEVFAQQDLFDYRSKLSDSDWQKVTGWRQTALTDQRTTSEEGLSITSAMSQAQTSLAAVGITTAGLTSNQGSRREEVQRQEAQFMMALSRQLEAFQRDNQRAPNQMETQAMINRLLLPVVMKQQGAGWFGSDTSTPGRLFEFDQLGLGFNQGGTSLELNIEYGDIPVGERVQIEQALREQLGRQPSQDEVITTYERYLMERR